MNVTTRRKTFMCVYVLYLQEVGIGIDKHDLLKAGGKHGKGFDRPSTKLHVAIVQDVGHVNNLDSCSHILQVLLTRLGEVPLAHMEDLNGQFGLESVSDGL